MIRSNPCLYITFMHDADRNVRKSINVLTSDNKLMTNYIRSIIKNHNIVSVDPEIGNILLYKHHSLKRKLDHIEGLDCTTRSEVRNIRNRIRKNEELFINLFGIAPDFVEYGLTGT